MTTELHTENTETRELSQIDLEAVVGGNTRVGMPLTPAQSDAKYAHKHPTTIDVVEDRM